MCERRIIPCRFKLEDSHWRHCKRGKPNYRFTTFKSGDNMDDSHLKLINYALIIIRDHGNITNVMGEWSQIIIKLIQNWGGWIQLTKWLTWNEGHDFLFHLVDNIWVSLGIYFLISGFCMPRVLILPSKSSFNQICNIMRHKWGMNVRYQQFCNS